MASTSAAGWPPGFPPPSEHLAPADPVRFREYDGEARDHIAQNTLCREGDARTGDAQPGDQRQEFDTEIL